MSATLEVEQVRTASGSSPAQPVRKSPPRQEMSALDAAAVVVARAKHPLTAAEIVARMAEKGLWASPTGKTPEATVSAAILREIFRKGPKSRFRKAGRGKYERATGK